MAKIGELYVAITGDNSSLKSSLKDSSKDVSKFQSDMVDFAKKAAISLLGVSTAIKGIQFNAAAESAQKSFEVMLGSASKAKDMLSDLKDYANKTPLEFADIRDASQTLLQFGVSAKDIMPTLKALGDVSGGNAQKLQSLSLAFGQMSSTGRLMGQDLLQMINAGFNPLNVISKKTGESMADLKKRMEAGGVSAQEVADAFKTATSEGGQFYQMLEKQAGTINGSFSTLNDAVDTFLGKATEGMSGPLVKAMQDASKNLGKMGKDFAVIGESIGGVLIVLNGIANAIVFTIEFIDSLTFGLGGLVIALGAVAVAVNLAFGGLPAIIAAITMAIGLVVKGISDMVAESDAAKKAEEERWKALKSNLQEEQDERKKLQKYKTDQKKADEDAKKAAAEAAAAKSKELAKLMEDYKDYGKTALQVLDEEEAATIDKAKKAGATEADLDKIRGTYLEKRKQMYLEDAEAAGRAAKAGADAVIAADTEKQRKLEEAAQTNYDTQLKIAKQLGAGQVDWDSLSLSERYKLNAEYAEWLKGQSDELTDYLESNNVNLTESERKELDTRIKNWSDFGQQTISGVEQISTAMGEALAGAKDGWKGVAQAAIKAVAQIVRALANSLAAKAAEALVEAIALSLNPLTWGAAPGKYAEAGGYAAGVAGIYAAAGAIEQLANYGAGTSAVPQTGSYLVGEYGPEMVTLPKGASVQTNAVTSAKMGATYNVTNVYNSPTAISAVDADRLSRRAMREMRAFA